MRIHLTVTNHIKNEDSKMKKTIILIIYLGMFSLPNYAQESNSNDSIFEKYTSEQDNLSQSFSNYFYRNYEKTYSLDELKFISVIDSLRKPFTDLLARFQKENPEYTPSVIYNESKDIHYFFDKIILDYPYYHERYTGEKKAFNPKLDSNLKDFNNPELLNIDSYVEYLICQTKSIISQNFKTT